MAQTAPAPTTGDARSDAATRRPRIGILALQGDVREHANALQVTLAPSRSRCACHATWWDSTA